MERHPGTMISRGTTVLQQTWFSSARTGHPQSMQGPFAAISEPDPFAPMLAGPWHASKLYLISFHDPLDHRYVHDSEAPLGKVLEI